MSQKFQMDIGFFTSQVALMGVLYKGRTNQICIYILNLIS